MRDFLRRSARIPRFFHSGARASALPPTQSGAAQPRPCASIVRRRSRSLAIVGGSPSRGPVAPALWAGAPPGPGSRGQAPGPLSAGRHRPGRLQRYGARPAHAGRRHSRRRRGRPFMQQGGLPPGAPGVQAAPLVRRSPWCSVRGRPPGPPGSAPPGCARPVARGAGTPPRRAQAAAAKRRPRPQTGRPGHRRRCPPPAPAGRGGSGPVGPRARSPPWRLPPAGFAPRSSAAGASAATPRLKTPRPGRRWLFSFGLCKDGLTRLPRGAIAPTGPS